MKLPKFHDPITDARLREILGVSEDPSGEAAEEHMAMAMELVSARQAERINAISPTLRIAKALERIADRLDAGPPKRVDNEYDPCPPGETLDEMLKMRSVHRWELARAMNQTVDVVDRIITGEHAITREVAEQIGLFFKMPTEFWLEREFQYRTALLRRELGRGKNK